jgi:hypothetical protein
MWEVMMYFLFNSPILSFLIWNSNEYIILDVII